MATKLSSAILASNLETLKDRASELSAALSDINAKASAAGSSLADMTSGALGQVQALATQVNRLNTALQRTSTTSSTIGAANVSSALGHLTGQGRGGGGGGGGAPRAASGGFGQGLGTGIGGQLFNALPAVARLVAAPAAMMAGMTMSGFQQTRNARLGWEQSRYYSPIANVGKRGRPRTQDGEIVGWDLGEGIKQFSGFARSGFDADRAAQITEGLLGATGGRGQGGGAVKNALSFTRFGTQFGMAPEEMLPLASAMTLGGGGMGETFATMRGIADQTKKSMTARGFHSRSDPTALRAERFRLSKLLTQQVSDAVTHQAQFGRVSGGTTAQMTDFLGVAGRAIGQPDMAGSVYQQLRAGTLSPGGGAAGQVFNLQAAGFGNPYLAAERATAERLGITGASLERRNYLQARLFKEEDPVGMILNQMIGVATKFRGQDSLTQGYGLSEISGLGLGQSKDLMEALLGGKFSGDAIRDQINRARIGETNLQKIVGHGETDLMGPGNKAYKGLMQQQAELRNVLLASSDATLKASANLNALQQALYKLSQINAGHAVEAVEKILSALSTGSWDDAADAFTALKDLAISLRHIVELTPAATNPQ